MIKRRMSTCGGLSTVSVDLSDKRWDVDAWHALSTDPGCDVYPNIHYMHEVVSKYRLH